MALPLHLVLIMFGYGFNCFADDAICCEWMAWLIDDICFGNGWVVAWVRALKLVNDFGSGMNESAINMFVWFGCVLY